MTPDSDSPQDSTSPRSFIGRAERAPLTPERIEELRGSGDAIRGKADAIVSDWTRRTVNLETSESFLRTNERLGRSEEIVRHYQEHGPMYASARLTAILDELVESGQVAGLMISSPDGLVIAESHRMEQADLLAAISAMFEYVVNRVQTAGIMPRVEEMTLRGKGGELVVVRYFPGACQQFFLVAFAPHHCPYRRVTNLALKRCLPILESFLIPLKVPGTMPPSPGTTSTKPTGEIT